MKKLLIAALAVVLSLGCVFAFAGCKNYDYNIGVQNGTTGQLYVKGDADWGFKGFSNIDCKGFDNGGLAVQAMKNRNVDFVIIDEAPAKKLVEKIEGIKLIDIKLTDEEYAYGVDKNQPELLSSINSILETIKSDGRFDAIIEKYFSGTGTITGIQSANEDSTKNQLVVATNAAFAPFEYKEGNMFCGIDIEIAKLIADSLSMELVIKDMDFDAVVTSVGKNGVDVAMAGLTKSEERAKVINFSDTYYNASQMLICLESDTRFDACVTAADVEAVLNSKK